MEIDLGEYNFDRFSYLIRDLNLKISKETRNAIEAALTLHKHLSIGLLKQVCIAKNDDWFMETALNDHAIICYFDGNLRTSNVAHNSYWQLPMKWGNDTVFLHLVTRYDGLIHRNVTSLFLDFLTPERTEDVRRMIDEESSLPQA